MDNLFSIAERFGTPCFVFDEVQLEARMRAVREIVPKAVGLCYSIKANPFLISAMRGLVGHAGSVQPRRAGNLPSNGRSGGHGALFRREQDKSRCGTRDGFGRDPFHL